MEAAALHLHTLSCGPSIQVEGVQAAGRLVTLGAKRVLLEGLVAGEVTEKMHVKSTHKPLTKVAFFVKGAPAMRPTKAT